MKLSPTPVRLAVVIPCVALLGVAQAQDAPAPVVPPAPDAAPAKPAEKPLELPDPVATVNGEEISKAKLQEAFDSAIKAASVDPATLSNDEKLAGYNKLLEDLVMDTLLKAESAGIEVSDADVDKEIAEIKASFPDEAKFEAQLAQFGQTPEKLRVLVKDGMKQRKWIESQVGDSAKATEADAKKFYDENPQQFERPEQVAASHILFMIPEGAPEAEVKKKEEAAKAALEKAKATKTDEEFNALAKELSEEPGAKERGGDLGLFSKEMMVPEFADAAFAAKVGEVVGPVKSQFGYHVIKVTDRKDAGKMTFDEVKAPLVEELGNMKQQEAVMNVVSKVRADAKVETKIPKPATPAVPSMPATGQGTNP